MSVQFTRRLSLSKRLAPCDFNQIGADPSHCGLSLRIEQRGEGPQETVPARGPYLIQATADCRVVPPTHQELERATHEHNKDLADYIGDHLTVVVGDLSCLTPPKHLRRGDLKRKRIPKRVG